MESSYLYIETTAANWTNPNNNIDIDSGKITIWRIKTADFLFKLDDFKAILDVVETAKFLRFKIEADQQTRIISRAILRILLGRYLNIDPEEIQFTLNHQKKPILKNSNAENLHFNVSHSGNWILIAVSTYPIGVDLEYIDTSFTYQNLLNFSFNIEEKNYIQTSKLPHQTFYQLWTRKEALLKATGKGLIDDLALIPSLDGICENPSHLTNSAENWQITSFNIDENHIGSAVFMPVKTALQFFNFQL